MHRVDTEGHDNNRFASGNPQIGQQGTIVDHQWLNDVQENLCVLIEFAGLVLAKGDHDQLKLAIQALDTATLNAAKAYVDAGLVAEAAARIARVPAGSMTMFAGSVAPAGWLECNGDELLIADYPALHAVIGATYGAAAALHFKVPDMRGMFARGWDHGRGVDAGRALGTDQNDQNLAHGHATNQATSAASSNDTTANGAIMTDDGGSLAVNWMVASSGGTEARPKNLALMFIIRT